MSKDKKSDREKSSDLSKRLKELEKKVEKPTQITRIKRLEELQEKLEGTHKIKKLKRLEKIALVPQIIIVVFLFFLSIYLNGGSLEPLYIPIYTSLIILGLWLIFLPIELVVFNILEIKYGKSKSSNFLLAKKSIRKGYQFAVIFILIFAFFFVPFFTTELSEASSIEKEIDLERGTPKIISFTSRGQFNFMITKNITVEIHTYGKLYDDNTSVIVHLYEKSNYEEDKNITINSDSDDLKQATLENAFHYQFTERDFEENILYLNANRNITVGYEIEKTIPKEKNFYFSAISLTIAIIYIGRIFLLNKVKKEETKEAIYH